MSDNIFPTQIIIEGADPIFGNNNREIIFERIAERENFRLLPDQQFSVPPGAKVQEIAAFSWCDGSPCIETVQSGK